MLIKRAEQHNVIVRFVLSINLVSPSLSFLLSKEKDIVLVAWFEK